VPVKRSNLMNTIKSAIRGTPLEPPARWLRTTYRNFFFRRAMKRLLNDPESSLNDRSVLTELVRGWANERFSADVDYIEGCLQYVSRSGLPILECGSGLTTILAGLIAQKHGVTIWSLEHNKSWCKKVDRYLKMYNIDSVRLMYCPLKDYGDYSWYDIPLNSTPERFSLVICDGPPRNNKGGRYGLMPVMKRKLTPGCIILLDDANWDVEQSNVNRWSREFGVNYEKCGNGRPYFVISIPAVDE